MYAETSENYKKAIAEKSRHFSARLEFQGFKFEGREIYSIKYDGGSSCTDYLTIGTVLSACLTVQMTKTDYKLANLYFNLSMGLEISENNFEFIPMGKYKVMDVQTKAGKTTLQCQDCLAWSDFAYNSKLNYPCKLSDIASEISEILGSEINIHDYPDYEIRTRPDNYTIREMLGFIGMMWGCFCVCGRTGEIDFLWYSDNGHTLTLDRTEAPEIAEENFELKYLVCYYDGENYYEKGDAENTGNGIAIENPYMTEGAMAAAWEKLRGFEYRACEIKCLLGDPRVDVWDLIGVSITNTMSIKIPVMQYSWDFDGGFQSRITSSVETDSEAEYRTGAAAASKSTENSAGTAVYYAALANDKNIGIMRETILRIQFSARENTVPVLGATIQLDLNTGGEVCFSIIYDSSVFCEFRENYTEQQHCWTLAMPLPGVANGSHEIIIAIQSEVALGKAVGGSCYGYVMGSSLVENNAWDGTITIREKIGLISARNTFVAIAEIFERTDCKTVFPTMLAVCEKIPGITAKQSEAALLSIKDELVSRAAARNVGSSIIVLAFTNPVYSEDLSVCKAAFEVTAVIGITAYRLEITDVYFSGLNEIILVLPEGSITGGTVSIVYTKIFGNLRCYTEHEPLADFVAAFEPKFEEE